VPSQDFLTAEVEQCFQYLTLSLPAPAQARRTMFARKFHNIRFAKIKKSLEI
jgi:hypothetical protein